MVNLKIIFSLLFLCGYTVNGVWWNRNTDEKKLDSYLLYTKIPFEGKIVSIEMLMEKNRINTYKQFISKYPNVMYTVIKCKYSEIVSDMLQLLYENISYCQQKSSHNESKDAKNPNLIDCVSKCIDRFISIKPDIVKMLFVLFKKSDTNQELRTSDQNLLKSLLSINLFLYYAINEKPFNIKLKQNDKKIVSNKIRVLCKIINQMIILVEHYRCKNCYVPNIYEYKMSIRKKLSDMQKEKVVKIFNFVDLELNKLRLSINIKNCDYRGYKKNLYDPDNVLFKTFFQVTKKIDIDNADVEWNKKKLKLKSVYQQVKKSYDIFEIFEYQKIILKVIAKILNKIVYRNLHTNNSSTIKPSSLSEKLETFVSKIIPSDCLTDVWWPFLYVKDGLYSFSQNEFIEYNSKKKLDLKINLNYLIENSKVEWSEKEELIIDTDLTIDSLATKCVVTNDQFKVFSQVVRLLSSESNTNGDHSILNVSDCMDKEEEHSYDTSQLKSTKQYELRYNLTLFRMLLANIRETKTNDTGVTSINIDETDRQLFLHVSNYIIGLHDNNDGNDNVKPALLLPLLIRFRFVLDRLPTIGGYDLATLDQIAYVTIIAIERDELKNIAWPIYSSVVYDEIISEITSHGANDRSLFTSETISFMYMKEKLREVAEKYGLLNPEGVENAMKNIHYRYFYGDSFPKADGNLYFYWNGGKTPGFQVLQYLQEAIFDANDLHKYRRYTIKFMVAKVLVKMKMSLLYYRSRPQKSWSDRDRTDRKSIAVSLSNFVNLNLPSLVKVFVTDLVGWTLRSFDSEFSSVDKKDQLSSQLVSKRLEELGAFLNSKSFVYYQSISAVSKGLSMDVDRFRILLEKYEQLNTLNFEDDLSKSFLQSKINLEPDDSPK